MKPPPPPGTPRNHQFKAGMGLGGRVTIAVMIVWWIMLAYYQARTGGLRPYQLIVLGLGGFPLGIVAGAVFTIGRLLLRQLSKGIAGILLCAAQSDSVDDATDSP